MGRFPPSTSAWLLRLAQQTRVFAFTHCTDNVQAAPKRLSKLCFYICSPIGVFSNMVKGKEAVSFRQGTWEVKREEREGRRMELDFI